MLRRCLKIFLSLVALSIALLLPRMAKAHGLLLAGTPNSTNLGVGIVLPTNPPLPAEDPLASSQVNWVRIDADWAALQPQAGRSVHWDALQPAFALAQRHELPVLLSLTHAPAWALTPTGPDPAATQQFVLTLVNQYPDSIRAIELFPEANTVAGWGTAPNPAAYLALYRQVQSSLSHHNVFLVALGLRPLDEHASPQDMDDLAYLDAFYENPEAAQVPVISLRLYDVSGDPAAPPAGGPHPTLRHYEQVRAQMQFHQHEEAILWLSYVSRNRSSDDIMSNPRSWQASVLQQVQHLLYVGTVFFSKIETVPANPTPPLLKWNKGLPKETLNKRPHASSSTSPRVYHWAARVIRYHGGACRFAMGSESPPRSSAHIVHLNPPGLFG